MISRKTSHNKVPPTKNCRTLNKIWEFSHNRVPWHSSVYYVAGVRKTCPNVHITQLLGIKSPTDICFGDVQNPQKRDINPNTWSRGTLWNAPWKMTRTRPPYFRCGGFTYHQSRAAKTSEKRLPDQLMARKKGWWHWMKQQTHHKITNRLS